MTEAFPGPMMILSALSHWHKVLPGKVSSATSIFRDDSPATRLERRLSLLVSAIAIIYGFAAGLRTVTDLDLGWQLATARWIATHHAIPSVDVFSYTAAGRPWIYPIGAGLVLYAVFLAGGYSLLSWLGAGVCGLTTGLLLRRGSLLCVGIAILAVPIVAARTTPRAEMFTVGLFAAFVIILWRQHERGDACLWVLPFLMALWVNLHTGFVAGLAMAAAYIFLELVEVVSAPEKRRFATARLRRAFPFIAATVLATLINPWGWRVYEALLRQQEAMSLHSHAIAEWASLRLNWETFAAQVSLRNPGGAIFVLLLVATGAIAIALIRRQFGAAILLTAACWLGIRHARLQVLFAVLVSVIAGAVLAPTLDNGILRVVSKRMRSLLVLSAASLLVVLAAVRIADLVTDRRYLASTDSGRFGAGLSWWFPERAAAFIQRENAPGEILNSYNLGGYITWRLGPDYRDYIDGRAIPFGAELLRQHNRLMNTSPGALAWQREVERYGINTVIVSLARYDGLALFPVLPQFCASPLWRPVYLDEVSAIFVRYTPATEAFLRRTQVDCATAPLPTAKPEGSDSERFNQWANAAAVLFALGRSAEALAATSKAIAIFPDNASVHYVRASALENNSQLREAEQEYRTAVALEPSDVTWSALAEFYRARGQLSACIEALKHAADLSLQPYNSLVTLAYAYLEAGQPREALGAFDRAQAGLPRQVDLSVDAYVLALAAHGRAIAWRALGDLGRAVAFEEEALRLAPDQPEAWLQLARMYQLQGRSIDAERARAQAKTASSQSRQPLGTSSQ